MFVGLGVTGCIAAYKAVELIRTLRKRGCEVQVVATPHALEFVTRLTFETISGQPLLADPFQRDLSWEVEHVSLARKADVLCVAPATANILAKFARGIADDFLSTLYLATLKPVVVAPAMNFAMWAHPATRENVGILRSRGVRVVDPSRGQLACGEEGEGRLADPGRIAEAVFAAATPGTLAGKTVMITAGPTAEDLDPIRFITNRSTGTMGFALARIAARRGARVILVAGPTTHEPDFECDLVSVRSAADMAEAVENLRNEFDIGVFAAAVADYTPESPCPEKIKKTEGSLGLQLVRTRDILAHTCALRRGGQVLVGFAAETADEVAEARRKLSAKGADLMVANRVGPGSGFGAVPSAVTLVHPDGTERVLEPTDKDRVAGAILDEAWRIYAHHNARMEDTRPL
ncbi:MAG: bifunctional phosphopantothenoylcysteine decarboxylase/phosphopantothenate--cysteine ligase CoaBC [Acidobacteria bacterium]|nr:bifunctional phosphopantothenoylcysteine decarboxylase/phosphopantothenate--cysteine ligase CoaBC [Acidobacteriota bacterium]